MTEIARDGLQATASGSGIVAATDAIAAILSPRSQARRFEKKPPLEMPVA